MLQQRRLLAQPPPATFATSLNVSEYWLELPRKSKKVEMYRYIGIGIG